MGAVAAVCRGECQPLLVSPRHYRGMEHTAGGQAPPGLRPMTAPMMESTRRPGHSSSLDSGAASQVDPLAEAQGFSVQNWPMIRLLTTLFAGKFFIPVPSPSAAPTSAAKPAPSDNPPPIAMIAATDLAVVTPSAAAGKRR